MHIKPLQIKGFTLIELLVVISIIALLIGILLPALGAARATAKQVQCLANQRSFGQAECSFAADNRDYMVRGGYRDNIFKDFGPGNTDNGLGFTFYALAEYLGLDKPQGDIVNPGSTDVSDWMDKHDDLFHCPSVDDRTYSLGYAVNSLWFQGFKEHNLYLETTYRGSYGGRWSAVESVDMVTRTSGTYLFAEMNITDLIAQSGYTLKNWQLAVSGVYTKNHLNFEYFNGRPRPGSRLIAADDDRHRGRTTLAFFDGHAEAVELDWKSITLEMFNDSPAK